MLSGQYRAMIHGIVGNRGIFSNVQSVTYSCAYVASGSNPTLTAILKSVHSRDMVNSSFLRHR